MMQRFHPSFVLGRLLLIFVVINMLFNEFMINCRAWSLLQDQTSASADALAQCPHRYLLQEVVSNFHCGADSQLMYPVVSIAGSLWG